ncbi:MAG: septum formation initiator [Flavobacteriaceae bacterium]|nr:septum formation initiator [Flavobacteriaceae bacterium]|tara:strand:+ start:4396 stop:4719 length:324 start_codon:yes stop_codon:yes gene_type:complete
MKNKLILFKKWLNIYRNIFLFTSFIFIIWMLFFDANSWLIHRELNNEIEQLKSKKSFYSGEIKMDNKLMKKFETIEGLEKYAREKYYMKKKNEDIFIIVSDTVRKKN